MINNANNTSREYSNSLGSSPLTPDEVSFDLSELIKIEIARELPRKNYETYDKKTQTIEYNLSPPLSQRETLEHYTIGISDEELYPTANMRKKAIYMQYISDSGNLVATAPAAADEIYKQSNLSINQVCCSREYEDDSGGNVYDQNDVEFDMSDGRIAEEFYHSDDEADSNCNRYNPNMDDYEEEDEFFPELNYEEGQF